MKQILFYSDTPNVGGAEKHMLLLAKYLNLNGVKVSLAYGKYSQLRKMHSDFEKYCKDIFILNTIHKHDPRHYIELKKVLSSNSFDIIHLHLWNPGSCRYAFFAAEKSKVPVITTEHDPFELSGMKKFIKQRCLLKTESTIVVSMDNYRLLDDMYNLADKGLEIVHNGIEIDRFLDNNDKANLPVQKGDTVITCIAELHHRKGHRYLLEAFKKLQTHMPKLQLILVGTGPAELELKEYASQIPNVHFLRWRNDIPQILKASDIFILPSLREAFGLSVVEAMASGVTTIATNNGGTTDIIQDGVTGYLVPPANSDAIYNKAIIALKNPHHKKEIEREALKSVKKNFTAKKMAKETLEVYKKIW